MAKATEKKIANLATKMSDLRSLHVTEDRDGTARIGGQVRHGRHANLGTIKTFAAAKALVTEAIALVDVDRLPDEVSFHPRAN